MVKERVKNKTKYYICEECDMCYLDRKWAEKCQSWCKKHKSCNTQIIKHAIRR
jgi:hypothetical protein